MNTNNGTVEYLKIFNLKLYEKLKERGWKIRFPIGK